jgi:hypothetical protein
MPDDITPNELKRVLDALASDLEAIRIRVPESGFRDGEAARSSLVADIRTYFAARLDAPAAPVVVAVMGPSGVGASSIVNALVGEPVSPIGVLRPTTKAPVLWAPHGASGRWWDEVRRRYTVEDRLDVVVGETGGEKARGWVVVDVPAAVGPAESIDLAARADLCVFVSSPARYADAEAAATAVGLFERGVPVWFVMNKLPEDPVLRFETVEAYAGLLHSWDLIDRPSPDLIETAALTSRGTVVRGDLGRLRALLASLADDDGRRLFFQDAMAARLAAVGVRAEEVAESIEDDRDILLGLTAASVDAYAAVADEVGDDLERGHFSRLAEHGSWLEAAVDLSGILTRRAGLAAGRTAAEWEKESAGRSLLAGGGGPLRRHGEHAAFESQGLLEAWYEEFGDAAAAAGTRRATRRRRSRLAAGLWQLVVDPGAEAPRRLGRRLGASPTEVTAGGRARLADTLRAALERDRVRFDDFLGPLPDVARLGRIITAASRIGAVSVTDFGSRTFAWEHGTEADAVSGGSADAADRSTDPSAASGVDMPVGSATPTTAASIPEVPAFELPEVPDAPPEAPATAFGGEELDEEWEADPGRIRSDGEDLEQPGGADDA